MHNTEMSKEMNKSVENDSAKMGDNKMTDFPVGNNNLDSLVADQKLKFIFVGGKGGVGKTTSSAAIATQLSFNRKGKIQINRSYGIII